MITNVAQLDQTVEQLKRMYRALASLRAELLDRDPRRFALLAEGPVEMIHQLQAQIDQYTGQSIVERLSKDNSDEDHASPLSEFGEPAIDAHSPQYF
jgi:hypothetical protein